MGLEYSGKNRSGDSSAVVNGLNGYAPLFAAHRNVHVPGASKSRVLEDIQQHIPHFVFLRKRPHRSLCSANLPLHFVIPHLLQTYDIPHYARDIDVDGSREICWRATIATEGARNFVETVDLRENTTHVVVEHTVEVHARVVTGTT
jgi:hypothetical protein